MRATDGNQSASVMNDDGLERIALDPETGRHTESAHALTGHTHTRIEYDEKGRATAIVDKGENRLTIERDGDGKPLAIIAPGGQRTVLTVNAAGQLTGIANEMGESYRMEYDSSGLLTRFTDPGRQVSEYAYDGMGLLTEAKTPAGGIKRLTRTKTADGTLVTYTDPNNRTTAYETKIIPGGSAADHYRSGRSQNRGDAAGG
ncbi:hypothetical protein OMP38_33185 [Cohnella ginsengisoli]|uniref:Teneurin-like YD-shell domain-containing protein n=1 Tax=Cohnella ginsengisoli TaxID=425004 RepID=A0A9X4QRR7_9BACL|nr:RHS repeat protein [Cohnella ginsengisoli]MDG0795140.1 hypothetical protein [Cohnella ginsengisoli]